MRTMKRTMTLLLLAAVLVVSAAPVGAKKPDNPGKPGSGPTNPPECVVADSFVDVELESRGARDYTAPWIELEPADLPDPDGRDLCVEVTVVSGTLGDMNVALVDYPDQAARRCGFYWPGGKINEGDVFNVGFSLDGYTVDQRGFCGSDSDADDYDGLVVLVMPKLHAKTDVAILDVSVGFAEVAP